MKMITALNSLIVVSSFMPMVYAAKEEGCLMGAINIKSEAAHGVIDITSIDALNKHKNNGKPTVVKCYTTWCGPCKTLKEPYEDLAREYGASVNFLAADGDMSPNLMHHLEVEGYPTFVFYDKNGSLLFSRVGGMSKGVLMDLVEQLKNGTMQKQNMKQKIKKEEKPAAAAAPTQEEPKQQPRKQTPTKKAAAPKKSMSRRRSAPREIKRGGVRYIAVEEE